MSKTEARLTAALAIFLILLVWLIEFKRVLDFNVGAPREATGRITVCDGIGEKTGWLKWKKEKILLTIDRLGSAKLAFTKPSSARQDVIALCAKKARVRVTYQVKKLPFRSDYQYWLRSIHHYKTNKVIFTQAERNAYKRSNRLWAYGVLAFGVLALFYAAGIQSGLIHPRDIHEFKQNMHHGYRRGLFVIRSRERRFSAFAYLFLSAGLGFLLAFTYLFKQREIVLIPLALFAFAAAYSFLVEIVNVNEISFKEDALLYSKRPLPWFFSRKRIPIGRIERIIPEVTRETSSHGPETRYSIAVRHPDGNATTLFFINSFSEAKAIAELTNRHLQDHYGFVIPAVLDQKNREEGDLHEEEESLL